MVVVECGCVFRVSIFACVVIFVLVWLWFCVLYILISVNTFFLLGDFIVCGAGIVSVLWLCVLDILLSVNAFFYLLIALFVVEGLYLCCGCVFWTSC